MAELDLKLSAWEIKEWAAYEFVSGPLGGERVDMLAAMLAKTMVNLFRSKGSREATVTDYMPKWGTREVNDHGEHS